MADTTKFVKSIIFDYVDNGYCEQVNDNTIKSLVDDTEISFEPLLNEDESKVIGLNVFTDGTLTVSAEYTDENFVDTVNLSVMSDLKAL